MNFAHVHLVLNHIPVVGVPVALVFLVIGYLKKNLATQQLALQILLTLSAMAIPVYLTGEPAEKVVENFTGITESLIEAHEDAAVVSLVLMILTGVASLVSLRFLRQEGRTRVIVLGTIAIAIAAVVSIGYTANLGGKVRHSEIRTQDAEIPRSDKRSE